MTSMNVAPLNIFSLRLNLIVLAGALLAPVCLNAQTAAAKPAAAEASSGPGFSIETEMLTYRALESNSEAIACDVASYLHGVPVNFSNPPQGSVCNAAGSDANSGVLIYPFDHSVFSDFQLWRADMQTMAEIQQRGAAACSAKPAPAPAQSTTPPGVSGRGLTATSPSSLLGLTPGGSAVAGAEGILGLFASDHAASPTGGTIQDQAMMDNIGRELRAASVPVMMPSVYMPYALSSIDPVRSPFAVALDKLFHTRDCLVAAKGATDPDAKNIDEFLASLASKPATPAPKPATAAQPATTTNTTGTPATPAAAAAEPAQNQPSHLQSVLSADGLAERLGADPQTGQIPDSSPQHVLLVKALESGGSVGKSTNIFGTKMSYSGGSVGTFALFDLKGELECSGNVYDYAGYIAAKDFQQHLRNYKPDPSGQVIFQRGSCRSK
jgi:hypothetical protein